MKKNLENIPLEVYLESIIEYIGLKEVGSLCMVSKTLKKIFDNNEIWKYLYIKTTSLKILETSIHIGVHNNVNNFKIKNILEVKPIYWKHYNNINQNGYSFKYACTCCSNDIAPKIEPLSEVIKRHPKYINLINNHTFLYIRIENQSSDIKKFYYNYIKNVHIKHNRENNLSTKNLCQNIRHYDINTLGNKGNNTNWKSYKIQTLKKLTTNKKGKVNGYEYRLKKKQKLVKRMEATLIQMKKEEIKLEQDKNNNNNFILKTKITLDIINKPTTKKVK